MAKCGRHEGPAPIEACLLHVLYAPSGMTTLGSPVSRSSKAHPSRRWFADKSLEEVEAMWHRCHRIHRRVAALHRNGRTTGRHM